MTRKVIFSLLVCMTNFPCFASQTIVKGNIAGASGYQVRLITFRDQVSNMRQTLATAITSQDGSFLLECNIAGTCYALLDIAFRQAEIYIQPGQTYEVSIKFDNAGSDVPYFDRQNLELTVVKDDLENLNRDIQDLNQMYNDFILKNFSSPGSKGKKELLDTFRKDVDTKFNQARNPYFRDYLKYKIAAIEQFMRIKSRETLGREYLAGQPILYDNVEYMDFFSVYFEKYMLINNKFLSASDIYGMVKSKVPANAFLDSLKKDPVLADKALREMVFLSGLKEMYYSQGIDKASVLDLLEQVVAYSTVTRTREIASDLITRLNHLAFGTKAPDFHLIDPGGNPVTIEALRGKPVYLYFFISKSPSCDAELESLSGLYLKYRSKIQFIGISADLNYSDFQAYQKTKNFPWPVCWGGEQLDLLESYDANTFPLFVLIDPKGNIFRYPAPRPTEDLEKVLENL